jgi:hypothetical protein
VTAPSFAIDVHGTVRWQNAAAISLLGDVRGRRFTAAVAPQDISRLRRQFSRKLAERSSADFEATLVTAGGRKAVLVEHHGPNANPGDPDRSARGSGNPVTYEAIRTPTSTYVEYVTGDREYYNLAKDPNELTNSASSLSAARRQRLHSTLSALEACHSAASCWRAARAR